MTFAFQKGQYGVRLADSANDLEQCQRLRYQCFYGGSGCDVEGIDDHCSHIMVAGSEGLVATCRVLSVSSDFRISYSAQRYDLKGISSLGPFIELGRFCIAPGMLDIDVLRLAWGGVTRIVDQFGAKMLFGCASFSGADPQKHAAALGLLARRYQAPNYARIGKLSKDTVALHDYVQSEGDALAQMPTLMRSYLSMGGWVSDHAVIDHELNTLHVFCGLEVRKIPEARARALRAVAG